MIHVMTNVGVRVQNFFLTCMIKTWTAKNITNQKRPKSSTIRLVVEEMLIQEAQNKR